MGALISAIGSAVGGTGLKDLVLGVLDRIKLSPEKKAEIQAQLDQNSFELSKMQHELEMKQQDYMAKEIETASANIKAEAESGDKFTSRSRPMFMYLIYVILGWNFIVLPIIQMFKGVPTQPIALPDDMYWLFGAGYLGYTGFRSLDKTGFKWNKSK
jgi:hypothetical protein